MASVLKISGLSKNYGAIRALQGLTLGVEQGQVWGILGPNGSGKTTTLSIILSTLKADAGDFRWFDWPMNQPANLHVGALLEYPSFYPYLSVEQNLNVAALIKKFQGDFRSEFERVLSITNLLQRRGSRYQTLSAGMKQRLAIASALLGDPQVLVLDEPTNGLDPEGIAEVRQIIQQQAQNGKTIIMASHILDEVQKVCSHVAVLKRGKLLMHGKVSQMLEGDQQLIIAADDIEKLYDLIARSGMYESLDRTDNQLILKLKQEHKPADVNEYVFKNGMVLSQFEVKQKTLESEFLELIKQTQQ